MKWVRLSFAHLPKRDCTLAFQRWFCGINCLTYAAELSLHLADASQAPLLAKTRHQIGELQQIRDPQEGTPLPHNNLGIRSDRVRPLRRNRANGAVVGLQQQPFTRAVIPLSDAKELPAAERVE